MALSLPPRSVWIGAKQLPRFPKAALGLQGVGCGETPSRLGSPKKSDLQKQVKEVAEREGIEPTKPLARFQRF